jgi:DNA polymerase III subunit delta'
MLPLYGHGVLRERLRHAIRRHTIPASLLLQGRRGVGKQQLALWLARVLICDDPERAICGECQQCRFAARLTHPDLYWVFPRPRLKDSDASPADYRVDYAEAVAERLSSDGLYEAPSGSDGIYVPAVHSIVQSAGISPAMARRKVFVVGDAERMVPQEANPEAANAFLKLLEEPPADTTIILTSSEPGALLPTIRSRVASIRVPPLSDADVRAFLDDPAARKRLSIGGAKHTDELVAAAGGAPGALLSRESWTDSLEQARKILDAASSSDRGARLRIALRQGASKARGSFSDMLDALTVILHDQARRAAIEHRDVAALNAAKAIEVIEEAKERASGNVNPQLITASLLTHLAPLLQ